MKPLFFAGMLCWASAWAANPAVHQVKTVYLLPMSNGLDQYLASELTSQSVLQVVTDPQKADAILTDKVGEALEEKLAELYTPKPEAEEEGEEEKSKPSTLGGDTAPRRGTSWGRGKGTVFLIERTTGNIIWSMYGQPKNTAPKNIAKQADKVASRLKKDRTVSQ